MIFIVIFSINLNVYFFSLHEIMYVKDFLRFLLLILICYLREMI